MPAIQTSSLGVGGFPSASTSFSSTPTVGNYVLVVGVFNPTFGSPPTGVTLTDNQTGNTYTATVYADTSNGAGCFIGRAPIVGASGTFTVTATVTGGAADAGVAVLIQERDDLGVLDQTGQLSVIFGTGSNFTVTASGANAGADRIVVAVLSGRNSQNISTITNDPPNTGYTNLFSRLSGGFGEPRGTACIKTVSAIETSSASWGEVTGPGGSGPMLIATFEVAGASGNTYTITPSGGITFSGTVTSIRERVIGVSGGIVLSGTAPITFSNGSVVYTITPSGGISLAGTVVATALRNFTVSGGLTFSGTVVAQRRRAVIPSGGIEFSGTNVAIREKVVVPTGSVTFSGTAPITFNGNVPTGPVSTRLPMTSVGQ